MIYSMLEYLVLVSSSVVRCMVYLGRYPRFIGTEEFCVDHITIVDLDVGISTADDPWACFCSQWPLPRYAVAKNAMRPVISSLGSSCR